MIFLFGGKGEGSIGIREDFGQDFIFVLKYFFEYISRTLV